VSSTTGIEVRLTFYNDLFHPKIFLPSYLHINGFIHRDVKAANFLIDDDGTVLLGDMGVAADLTEDTSQLLGASLSGSESSASQVDSGLGNLAARRVVLFDHTVPVIGRPRMGKRKSFVGTVRLPFGYIGCYDLSCDS
jgi:serine/threonine protein kinase